MAGCCFCFGPHIVFALLAALAGEPLARAKWWSLKVEAHEPADSTRRREQPAVRHHEKKKEKANGWRKKEKGEEIRRKAARK